MIKATPRGPEVWIGLAEAKQRPGTGVLADRNNAFVNVLALASSKGEFREAAADALERVGFVIVSLEDIEPLSRRVRSHSVASDLLRLADDVRATGTPRLGTFHTWDREE